MAVRESIDINDMTPEQMREALNQLREAEDFRFAIEKAMAESYVSEPEETQTRPKIDERALRGALFLDEHHPGWAKKINLNTFDLGNTDHCVVGQMFGKYADDTFRQAFKRDPGNGREESLGVAGLGTSQNYDEVGKSWRILIAERQQAA